MGEEIHSSEFSAGDQARFEVRLQAETRRLAEWLQQGGMAATAPRAGFELEAWLLDEQYRPAPLNARFLEILSSDLASPELASFNFEVNSTPRELTGRVFSDMLRELNQTWARCREAARQLHAEVIMTGILPTLQNEDLTLAHMSKMERYRALNREVLHMRGGKPLVIDIHGEEHLRVTHRDVMLESAATSFQIHLKLRPDNARRLFNAAIILSGPMVALSANSPYLFGKDLWAETRIPLFEQAVAVGGFEAARFGPIRRVTFGGGYVRDSLLELFEENLQHYPVMLPVDLDAQADTLAHLRMHNGTIWRWNRPLLGFDDDGRPHLRLEHRVVPAGPSLIDSMANAAFFYGAVTELAAQDEPAEQQLAFDRARDNFYAAARHGLQANQHWLNGSQWPVGALLREQLLPMARRGLERLGIAVAEQDEYLDIIAQRLASGRNGAQWQREFVARHGRDMTALTVAYLQQQHTGEPVHAWPV